MHISQNLDHFVSELQKIQSLPEELLNTLQHGSNSQYLDTVAALALDQRFIDTVYATHETLFVEISSRWLSVPDFKSLSALASYARILPLAPHLADHANALLMKQSGCLDTLSSREPNSLCDLNDDDLGRLLLAMCRLMFFDNERFASYIVPIKIHILLQHSQRYIKYLAIRIIILYTHASDSLLETLVSRYLGDTEVLGPWEDRTIDYLFLTLWEERRLMCLGDSRQRSSDVRRADLSVKKPQIANREISSGDLSGTTVMIGNVLIPTTKPIAPSISSMIPTDTTLKNMSSLARSLNLVKPLMITGLPGSGKSRTIREIAEATGNSSTMLTLHLNEQTDVKMLIGMHTNTSPLGSFAWRPGILTTATTEGRWILIEDIDRAPTELISTILPLIERREILVPNQDVPLRAAPGFRIFATSRTRRNAAGVEASSVTSMIGLRHWLQVPLQLQSEDELAEIVSSLFPLVRPHTPRMMKVYTSLCGKHYSQNLHSRPKGPLELFRWARRIQQSLQADGLVSETQPISESVQDDIFLDAVDIFASDLPHGKPRDQIVELIALELHIPSKRAEYCLQIRKPLVFKSRTSLSIGRASLRLLNQNIKDTLIKYQPTGNFAATSPVLRVLESVAISMKQGEACLLVGETGAGKTTIVQHLAAALGQKLVVVNLSQQSEAGDLLGGYKPINPRTLAMPMKDEFDELLQSTFPSRQNSRYLDSLTRAVAKGHWSRVLVLWQGALKTVEPVFEASSELSSQSQGMPKQKRRKIQLHDQQLKTRWAKFADSVRNFNIHLSNGSKGFAFSFVEGSIVKAVRNGHWVLLDEINLASQDTLESLAGLFNGAHDEGTSLLLPESGEIERVLAHDDFRVFGAMNPATDIGKHDLPPSIRSHFTEIFVEAPDKTCADLMTIVEVYLGGHCQSDVRITADIAQIYLDIKGLAENHQLIDGSGQKPHFSLRTLTRTLIYIADTAPIYGLRRASFEGFLMTFSTMLSGDSRSVVQTLIEDRIFRSTKNKKSLLHQTIRMPVDGSRRFVQLKQYWVLQGNEIAQEQPHYIMTPFVEQNLMNLVRATSTRRLPVLLQGPTSSGKTSMIEYLARISGNHFVRINNHEHTDLQEYLGTYVSCSDGHLKYQDGVLVKALKEGHWIVLDELNLASTDILEALNRLLDDNRELFVPETQQVIRPHDHFMLFATQNPPGMYGGRKTLSRAFRNRFLELHFSDIPQDELETILRERTQIAPSFCTRIVAVYKQLSILRQRDRLFEQRGSFATLRDLFRWAMRDADNREQLALNGFQLLAERVRNEVERMAVKRVIEDIMKVQIDEEKLYENPSLDVEHGVPPEKHRQEVIWTKSMRRLYVLVRQALKHKEPVLLVGDTGSGKTTICQAVARMFNKQLNIVNAYQNMEAGDLIGAQRPLRNRDMLIEQLATMLIQVLESAAAYRSELGKDLSRLLAAYDAILPLRPSIPSEEKQIEIANLRSRVQALFEWSDGSLVTAMKNGHHFLLDEISLAEDSVLERLNSVLEPSRTLFLAEKGTDDATITATEGFQLVATMNPGGDYGKRELSPALRNRFTEIWVPLPSDQYEAIEIVQAKLHQSKHLLAKPMVDFAHWFAATYNSVSSHLSIRDLLSWATFINGSRHPDLAFTVANGAYMVYLDRLGASPAAKTVVYGGNIAKQRALCEEFLKRFFMIDYAPMSDTENNLTQDEHCLKIGPFEIRKKSITAPPAQYSLFAPTTMQNAMKLARALQVTKPILLEGSPGVGKTTLVAAIAGLIGMPLTRINLSDQTDLMDLFGSDVPLEGAEPGQFGWRDAPFLRAMQKGEWVLLDEMNLASQSVLEGLNACFDHRGEIYVSELDRTFRKHPGFVVFAAQNPHHEGGGRKGLPTSFVDRFTVVYMDAFTEEDLNIICTEAFPQIDKGLVRQLTQCVNHISKHSQNDLHLNSHGGPWEFNLRDALRWLEILDKRAQELPAGSAHYYHEMLFSRRLRTFEDRRRITNLISYRLEDHGQLCRSFVSRDSKRVEVGRGILRRGDKSYFNRDRRAQAQLINLPLAESVMLCIEMAWPTLLVGPSGSGKTELILRLADLAGIEVVQLCLNPQMDTVDLLGGFEQCDIQRNLTNTIRTLKDYTQSTIVQHLALDLPIDSMLLELATSLQGSSVIDDILPKLRTLAEQYTSSDFPIYLDECQYLASSPEGGNNGRFEWVDGLLVRALKQGKWLILDNANLCNPSVLDRLNSLLEPNGYLSINEHRSADGSAEVVHPHPEFRLFLTMDPRYGELSRAMRNRSVELFMPGDDPESCDVPASLSREIDASVSRFALINRVEWHTLDDYLWPHLLPLLFEQLTYDDVHSIKRWQAQILNGISDLPKGLVEPFKRIGQICVELYTSNSTILKAIEGTCKGICQSGQSKLNVVTLQTLHPFNNSLLVQMTAHQPWLNNLGSLGKALDLLLDVCHFNQHLADIAAAANSNSPTMMSMLERSFTALGSPEARYDRTRPIAGLLRNVGHHIRFLLEKEELAVVGDGNDFLTFAIDILFYLNDILHLSHFSKFDESIFQVYLRLGRSLISSKFDREQSTSFTTMLASDLAQQIDAFGTLWHPCSGFEMERLWKAFRPPVIKTSKLHHLKLQIEELGQRFDNVRWSSMATITELICTQNSLVDIYRTDSQSNRLLQKSDNIKAALVLLEQQQRMAPSSIKPYFTEQFDILRQYASFGPKVRVDLKDQLNTLSGRSTAASLNIGKSSDAWSALRSIFELGAVSAPEDRLAMVRQVLPASILHQLKNVFTVPLRSLDLLDTELPVLMDSVVQLTRTLTQHPLSIFADLLQTLRRLAFDALHSNRGEDLLENWKSVRDLPQRLRAQNVKPSQSERRHAEEDNVVPHLHHAIQFVFTEPQEERTLGQATSRASITRQGSDYIKMFAGMILLYVPDKPCDPSLTSRVEHERYVRRQVELETKLIAVQHMDKINTGVSVSFRASLIRKALEALGQAPEVERVYRPDVSALVQLQSVFNGVLRSICNLLPAVSVVESVTLDESDWISINRCRQDIKTATERLSYQYRDYDDVAQPLRAMLNGLDTGLALVILGQSDRSNVDDSIQYICSTTPFMDCDGSEILKATVEDLERLKIGSYDPQIQYLETVALVMAVDHNLKTEHLLTTVHLFHKYYEEWRENLEREQGEHASKSSLYQYRGGESNSEQGDEEALQELFPSANYSENSSSSERATGVSPMERAQQLATLQMMIFGVPKDSSERLLAIIRCASQQIANLWSKHSEGSQYPVPVQHLLSPLHLAMVEQMERVHVLPEKPKSWNFYTDENIGEVRKLVTVVRQVQSRFSSLHESWPEHATPNDVLQVCNDLLAMQHTAPVAKLLTKVEQLHGYVNEWLVVASKEFSAAIQYDLLTQLIVSWRRLELTTWSRLLSFEDEKCRANAESWWFIAYETIIAAPLSATNTFEDTQAYLHKLMSTLGDFLATTSVGQYSHRLAMLHIFQKHATSLAPKNPVLGSVSDALHNLISYYERYEASTTHLLQSGRLVLERELKDVLLQASWKDTNISALRESAKRSHYKLLKLVRKYRTLLAQPTITIIAQSFEGRSIPAPEPNLAVHKMRVTTSDALAKKKCEQEVKGWITKPKRFTNPNVTAKSIQDLSQPHPDTVEASDILIKYSEELISNMKALQKSTPDLATKENIDLIKQLKAEKRKLFTDTLKDVRQMGFHSNPSSTTISKQESLPVIFSNMASFRSIGHIFPLLEAEIYFQNTLNVLPEIRCVTRQHHEDLSHGEVSRSLGYLESMISALLNQRSVIMAAATALTSLKDCLRSLSDMWRATSDDLRIDEGNQKTYDEIRRLVRWLPTILDTAIIIAGKCIQGSNRDNTRLSEGLTHWKLEFVTSDADLRNVPTLPEQLTSFTRDAAYAAARSKVEELHRRLEEWTEEYPDLSFVMQQIKPWTRLDSGSKASPSKSGHRTTISDVDSKISRIVDTVLVVVQKVSGHVASLPQCIEDARWLLRWDQSTAAALQTPGLYEISQMLQDLLPQLQYLEQVDADSLGAAAAVFEMAFPVIQQFYNVNHDTLERYVKCHTSLCRLTSIMSGAFARIGKTGFCSPTDKFSTEAGQKEKLEGGTGLGEGSGIEDISKEIQDDEDLSELAQQGQREKGNDAAEGEEPDQEGVNMDHDEMEGYLEDAENDESGANSGSEDDRDNIEEETGEIDDLDLNAVDEKLWDGRDDDDMKDKQGRDGKPQNDQIRDETGAADDKIGEPGHEEEEDVKDNEGTVSERGAEESEAVVREENEDIDPHAQTTQNLDLPDEMDLDSLDGNESGNTSDRTDLDNISNTSKGDSSEVPDLEDKPDGDASDDEGLPDRETQEDDELHREGDAEETVEEVDSPMNDDLNTTEERLEAQQKLQSHPEISAEDLDDTACSEAQSLGQANDSESNEARNQGDVTQNEEETLRDASDQTNEPAPSGQSEAQDRLNGLRDIGPDENPASDSFQRQAFKKLGDALEQWHRQQRQILDSQQDTEIQKGHDPNLTIEDHDVEHLPDDDAMADGQALGAASAEQARALDEQAFETGIEEESQAFPPDQPTEHDSKNEDREMEDDDTNREAVDEGPRQARPATIVSRQPADDGQDSDIHGEMDKDETEDINKLDQDLSVTHIQPTNNVSDMDLDAAQRLWTLHERASHDLSLYLTEQLRLILAPTLATKMRGDFRTGKRLNMKRIIPYIASQYKKDKIWMRRSIPTKRNYQIMLAVDDSKSMEESGSAQLAFQTLALVSKSLSMLEVGQICIVGFGSEVLVAHEFDKPLTADAGAKILSTFNFQQTKTDVRNLLAESMTIFREARQKTFNSGADLWQLQLIISDGVCEDHGSIRRLVCQAQEERIMMVFIIVDDSRSGGSIMNMSQAVFEPDGSGESKLKIHRYLDDFPFPYYLIVSDVKELPAVLAQALRQWFAEVVESG